VTDRDPSVPTSGRSSGSGPNPDARLFQPVPAAGASPLEEPPTAKDIAQLRVQMADLRQAVMTRLAEVQQGVVGALGRLDSELRATTERSHAGTVAALTDDLVELRMAVNSLLAAESSATDSIARLRDEGMLELRQALVEDVAHTVDQAASAMEAVARTGQDKGVEALRAELALFGVAFSQREQEGTQTGLAEVARLLDAIRDEVAGVHVTVQDVVGEADAAAGERLVELQDALRTVIEDANDAAAARFRALVADASEGEAHGLGQLRIAMGGAFERLQSDLGDLGPAIGRVELVSSNAADGVAALRAQLNEQLTALRRMIAEAMQAETRARETALLQFADELQARLGVIDRQQAAGLEASAKAQREHVDVLRAVIAASASLEASIQGQLQELQAFRGSAASAASIASLEATVGAHGLEHVVLIREVAASVAGLEAVVQGQRKDLEALKATVASVAAVSAGPPPTEAMRPVIEAAFADLRASLEKREADVVESTVGQLRASIEKRDEDPVDALREELAGTVRSLEWTLTEAQQNQQRILRDELADALVSVSQLVVDEAKARAAELDAATRRIDELARATAQVAATQWELRELLLGIWGGG
jgi:hypothetical protein